MWRRVPCEQPLHTGQSILSPRRNPMSMDRGKSRAALCLAQSALQATPSVGRKGIRFPFRNPVAEPHSRSSY